MVSAWIKVIVFPRILKRQLIKSIYFLYRLHDNPALLEAIRDVDDDGHKVKVTLYPIFIFDGESGGKLIHEFILFGCIV